jgi:hypothetical protein
VSPERLLEEEQISEAVDFAFYRPQNLLAPVDFDRNDRPRDSENEGHAVRRIWREKEVDARWLGSFKGKEAYCRFIRF